MNVEVFLNSSSVTDDDVKDRTVVIIDVLRACSTIVTALDHGARAVVPVPDMAEAGKIASNLDQRSYLLGGERQGEKIEGYHLGNSPLEYTKETVNDRTVILNTTNGTVALDKARGAEHLLVGCFLNAQRIVDFAREAALDLTIICAGQNKRVALEDTLCAGLILYQLWQDEEPAFVSDTARIAYTQYVNDQSDLVGAVRRCNHAQELIRKGFEADVDYCLQLDDLPVLPYYQDSRLTLKSGMTEKRPA